MSCFCQTSQSGHGFTLQINSLWPSDAIWQHNSGSTFAQVMTCCLTAPSHYLDQYWLLICEVVLHPTEGNFTANVQATILYNEFENCTFEISQGEWVNCVAAQIRYKLEDCNWVDDKLHYIFKRYHVEYILRLDWPEHWWFNSSHPSATYMHQWIRSALFQIMACCLFGAKPLSKPCLGYCRLEP